MLAFLFAMPLTGCAGTIFGVPTLFATEVAPRAVNGKGLAEDAADEATGKDCRIIEGTTHEDRKICEEKHSPATRGDFKGIEGALEKHEE